MRKQNKKTKGTVEIFLEKKIKSDYEFDVPMPADCLKWHEGCEFEGFYRDGESFVFSHYQMPYNQMTEKHYVCISMGSLKKIVDEWYPLCPKTKEREKPST